MTIALNDKVQHRTTLKFGIVVDIEIKSVCKVHRRYLRVKWENESEADNNYYFSQNLREVKSIESLLKKNASRRLKDRDSKLGRERLNGNSFSLDKHIDRSDRSNVLKPGQSTNETEWVDIDSIESDISDNENTEDTDRSKRRINIDAVNYQVSADCCFL
jgi:hypothetical protein